MAIRSWAPTRPLLLLLLLLLVCEGPSVGFAVRLGGAPEAFVSPLGPRSCGALSVGSPYGAPPNVVLQAALAAAAAAAAAKKGDSGRRCPLGLFGASRETDDLEQELLLLQEETEGAPFPLNRAE